MNSREPNSLPGEDRIRLLLRSVLRIAAGVLLALGIPALAVGLRDTKAASERTMIPIQLSAGERIQTEFKTAGRYPLDLNLHLHRHRGVADVLLDDVVTHQQVRLRILWKIFRGSTVVAHGRSEDTPQSSGHSVDFKETKLGGFELKSSGRYRLEATVEKAPDDLLAAEPTLMIKTNFSDAKSAGIRGLFLTLVGALSVIGGCVLAGASLLAKGKL